MGNTQTRKNDFPTAGQCQVLQELQLKVTTPYSDDSHEVLLRNIWKALHPNGEPFEMVSAFWKYTLAFQSPDPRTDIRGGGQLSLENLAYLIETYPDVVKKMLANRGKRNAAAKPGEVLNYPWAAAGINLTRKLCTLFQVVSSAGAKIDFSNSRTSYWRYGVSSMQTFNELYCYAFQSLDKIWDETGATYMEFNSVIDTTMSRLAHLLNNSEGIRTAFINHPGLLDCWTTTTATSTSCMHVAKSNSKSKTTKPTKLATTGFTPKVPKVPKVPCHNVDSVCKSFNEEFFGQYGLPSNSRRRDSTVTPHYIQIV